MSAARCAGRAEPAPAQRVPSHLTLPTTTPSPHHQTPPPPPHPPPTTTPTPPLPLQYPVASTSANERAEHTAHLTRRRGETVVCVFSMQARVGGRRQAALGSACTPSHLHDLSCYDLSCCGAVLDPRHVRLRLGLGQPGEHDDPGDPHGRVWPVWSDLQQHVAGHHLAPVVRCAQQGRGTLMRAASLTCRNC